MQIFNILNQLDMKIFSLKQKKQFKPILGWFLSDPV